MQERRSRSRAQSFPLEPPFLVIATQNPIELEGTYPLPEAQLDRFLLRVAVGYPERGGRARDPRAPAGASRGRAAVPTIISRAELLAMQAALEDVFVSDADRALHRGAGAGHAG